MFITCMAERRLSSRIKVLAANISVTKDLGSTAQSPAVWRSVDKAMVTGTLVVWPAGMTMLLAA